MTLRIIFIISIYVHILYNKDVCFLIKKIYLYSYCLNLTNELSVDANFEG